MLIALRNVEKTVPQGPNKIWLLRRIDLDVKEGEFVSIMGPSGAGKSTLLHLLGMHDSAWTGEYHLLGEAVHKLDKRTRSELQKKTIGFVFQSYHLLDDLTVYENLEIPLSYRDVRRASGRASWPTPSTASASWARRTSTRTSSRVDSSSWWRWPGR